MRLKIFLLFFSAKVMAFELPLDHPNYIPPKGSIFSLFQGGSGHREIEYETNEIRIDEQMYKFNELHFKLLYSPLEKVSFGTLLSYDTDREYELKYFEGSSKFGQEAYKSSSNGLIDPDLILVYQFDSRKDSWNQQLSIRFNPFDIKEQPRKNYRGGHDIRIEYKFSHYYESGNLYGSLFTEYFGEKDFYLPGDTRKSRSEPYSEAGLKLGYLYRNLHPLTFFLDGSFGLSSDYSIITPDIERKADKGFLIFANIGTNYFVSTSLLLTALYTRGSRIYNASNENIDRNIEFSIEDDSLFFGITKLWK